MIGNQQSPGIVPLSVLEVFEQISHQDDKKFLITASFIEVYMTKVHDLFDGKKEILQAGSNIKCGQKVIPLKNPSEIMQLYKKGNDLREVRATDMNQVSSRSHAIFTMFIESEQGANKTLIKTATLSLVDLAGNEKLNPNPVDKKESQSIVSTLYHLTEVVRNLSKGEEIPHYFYRRCKLTHLLHESLGGNSLTRFICTINPSMHDETETTLK